MNSKIKNKLLIMLLVITLILLVGISFTEPVYANADFDTRAPCDDVCEYVGMIVQCYDSVKCNQASIYKHAAYFRYYCYNRCEGSSWYQTFFQYCRTTC